MKAEPLVSVVIPTFNRREKLKRLLDSVLKSSYKNLEIIVVDDASTDGTFEEIKQNYPTAKLVRNRKELLLAGSRNAGIMKSSGELIFLVDDDNVIAEDTISELVKAMNSDGSAGVTGPLMYYLDDPQRIWCGQVKRSYVTSRTFFPERNKHEVNSSIPLESDDFPNAFMIRRAVIDRVGVFDAVNFKIHYDEADFCNRVRKTGLRVVLVPHAKVWHDIAVPTNHSGLMKSLRVNNEQRTFFISRNRIIFMKKYASRLNFFIFCFCFFPVLSSVYLSAILTSDTSGRQKKGCLSQYFRGIWAGLVWRE
jgi:GT2 family glycosyltransferase